MNGSMPTATRRPILRPGRALRHQRAELRPLQDLRHQGPQPEHQLGAATRRRRAGLPEHVSESGMTGAGCRLIAPPRCASLEPPMERVVMRCIAWARIALLGACVVAAGEASAGVKVSEKTRLRDIRQDGRGAACRHGPPRPQARVPGARHRADPLFGVMDDRVGRNPHRLPGEEHRWQAGHHLHLSEHPRSAARPGAPLDEVPRRREEAREDAWRHGAPDGEGCREVGRRNCRSTTIPAAARRAPR